MSAGLASGRTGSLSFAGLCSALWLPATPTPKHVDQRRATRSSAAEDRIGVDDTFDVRVYGEAELSGMFRVATDGTVDYPLAGRLQVAGLRTGEIQELLVRS